MKYQIDQNDKGYTSMLDCFNDIEKRKKDNAGNDAVLTQLEKLKGMELSPSYQKLLKYIES